jgi:hypothetical protein
MHQLMQRLGYPHFEKKNMWHSQSYHNYDCTMRFYDSTTHFNWNDSTISLSRRSYIWITILS